MLNLICKKLRRYILVFILLITQTPISNIYALILDIKTIENAYMLTEYVISERNASSIFAGIALQGVILENTDRFINQDHSKYIKIIANTSEARNKIRKAIAPKLIDTEKGQKSYNQTKIQQLRHILQIVGYDPQRLEAILLKHYKHKIHDENIMNLFTILQKKNINTLILSNNSPHNLGKIKNFDKWTAKYLEQKNISIKWGIFRRLKGIIKNEMYQDKEYDRSLYNGILSANIIEKLNPLHSIIVHILYQSKQIPHTVILIHNDYQLLKEIETQFLILDKNIEFIGYNYIGDNIDKDIKPMTDQEYKTEFTKLKKYIQQYKKLN